MKRISFLNYLLVIIIITIIYGVIYVSVQQSYRSTANDPQIQIVQDLSFKLRQNKAVDNYFTDTIDISQSLSTFVVLYDIKGKPIRSSGFLNGKMPELPAGVFDHTKTHHEYAVTWQPQNGVRIALVILNSNVSQVGFVASGRSLQEVEIREANLVTMVLLGWIICMGLVLLYAVIQFYRTKECKM